MSSFVLQCMLFFLAVTPPDHAAPIFKGIGHLPDGDYPTTPGAISADGLAVVGWSINSQGFGEAYLWTEELGMIGLGDLPPNPGFSTAARVSADGAVVVGKGISGESSPNTEAFLWTERMGMIGLGDLPGNFYNSEARSVSGDGLIVTGWSSADQGSEAFRWTAETGMVGLGALGVPGQSSGHSISLDGNTIVGWATGDGGGQAFRWTLDQGMTGLGDLPGGNFSSFAQDVSADGSVIVGESQSANGKEAFRWTEQTGMVGLGDLEGGAFESRAFGVSADGSIVVGLSCVGGGFLCGDLEPFIWDAAHGMRSLRAVLVENYQVDLTGWDLKVAGSVSADGLTIIGSGWNPEGEGDAWIARLPDCNGNGIADDLDIIDGLSADRDGDTIPDECQLTSCLADLNDDGAVNARDLAVLLGTWGTAPGQPADFDKDGDINSGDLVILLAAWGPCD